MKDHPGWHIASGQTEAGPRVPDAKEAAETLPECARGAWDVVRLFGMTINSVTVREVFEAVDQRIAGRKPGYIVTPNVDHVCCFQNDAEFREAYRHAFLVLPDGMPLIWASRLLGKPLREKISGSDLIFWLTEHAAERGHSVFFMGAAEGVGAEAARRLKERYPKLKVVGVYSPPMGFEKSPEANAETVRRLREAKPDICYIALSSPKQDIWSHRNCDACGVPILVGVGASLDFVTGQQKRAPRWMQQNGLEWAWRLCREPRRLWKRYLVRDSRFIGLLWREWRRKGRHAGHTPR